MTDEGLHVLLGLLGYIPMPQKVGLYEFYWQKEERSIRKLKNTPAPYRVELESFCTAQEVAEYLIR